MGAVGTFENFQGAGAFEGQGMVGAFGTGQVWIGAMLLMAVDGLVNKGKRKVANWEKLFYHKTKLKFMFRFCYL